MSSTAVRSYELSSIVYLHRPIEIVTVQFSHGFPIERFYFAGILAQRLVKVANGPLIQLAIKFFLPLWMVANTSYQRDVVKRLADLPFSQTERLNAPLCFHLLLGGVEGFVEGATIVSGAETFGDWRFGAVVACSEPGLTFGGSVEARAEGAGVRLKLLQELFQLAHVSDRVLLHGQFQSLARLSRVLQFPSRQCRR